MILCSANTSGGGQKNKSNITHLHVHNQFFNLHTFQRCRIVIWNKTMQRAFFWSVLSVHGHLQTGSQPHACSLAACGRAHATPCRVSGPRWQFSIRRLNSGVSKIDGRHHGKNSCKIYNLLTHNTKKRKTKKPERCDGNDDNDDDFCFYALPESE